MSSQLNISNVDEYLVEVIQEINPDIDLREGTAIRDLLVKALNVAMTPIIDEVIRMGNAQSLSNASSISEADMDELTANVFVTRRGGDLASGAVRIFLSTNTSAVEIPASTIFSTSDGLRFFSISRVFVTKQALSLNMSGNFFYLDVPIQAEFAGTQYNVEKGQINSMAVTPVNFVRVTNEAKILDGVGREDNVTLGDRAATAITVRDLVTEPGIITQLLENFLSLVEVQPIGFGDVEMIRDVVTTDGTFLTIGDIQYPPASGTSIGGMVDIYLKPVSQTTEELVVASFTDELFLREQEVDDSAPTGTQQYLDAYKRPGVDVIEIEELDAVLLQPTGTFLIRGTHWDTVVENETLTYSTLEKKKIVLTPTGIVEAVGKPYAIRYLHSADVVNAQAYVGSDVNRTVSASLLAKHAVPVFADLTMVVTQPSTFTQTAQTYIDAVTAFINALDLGETLEVSDIIDVLYDTASSDNRLKVTLPITLNADEHFVDGTIVAQANQDELAVDRTKVWLPRTISVTLVTT